MSASGRSRPIPRDYDYRPYKSGNNETVVITPASSPRPLQAGDWYVLLRAYKAYSGLTLRADWIGGVAILTVEFPDSHLS